MESLDASSSLDGEILKNLRRRLGFRLACSLLVALATTNASAEAGVGWRDIMQKLPDALHRRDFAELPEALGVDGVWQCGEDACEFISNRRDVAVGAADISVRLATDKERKSLSRKGITLDVETEDCYKIGQLESALSAKLTFVIPQPISHCVPDFFCKEQLATFQGMFQAGEGSFYEIDARASRDKLCLKQIAIYLVNG